MDEQLYQTPQNVTQHLDISSATLRRWSDEFSDYLSEEASSPKGRSHRRYNEEDVNTLESVKRLMDTGMTYEQVRQHLSEQYVINPPSNSATTATPIEPEYSDPLDDADFDESFNETPNEEATSLAHANGETSGAVAFMTNTLTTLSDNQKSLLNSQAANRELLGVLIQDNFNLKEENNRLRERLLDVERTLSQMRQEEEWRREALRQEMDAKLSSAQHLASEAMQQAQQAQNIELPEYKAVQENAGCLGSLFGGGGNVKIVPVSKNGAKPAASQGQPPFAGSASNGSAQPSASGPAHPKPMMPPE